MSSSHVSTTNNDQEEDEEDSGRFVPKEQDPLQRHAAFFDRNHDGIIYPWETFQGLRAIGCGIFFSIFSAFFINLALSPRTRPGKSFSLLLPIEVSNIHKAKHGSNTGVYDNEGRLVQSKFEEIFMKHAHTNADALTSKELDAMLKANREPRDQRGWVSAYTEWKLLFVLCKDKQGLLHKDTLRAFYDGSLFDQIEKERSKAAAKKKK